MNKLNVGMDVSQKDVKVYILDQDGNEAHERFFVDNNPIGADTIATNILECCRKFSIKKVFIGLESTSVYGWHLQFYLADYQELKPYDPMIVSFNAKIIDAFKKSIGNLEKNDWIDAFTIAERLRFGRLPKTCPVDFRYLALQRLTRYRFHLVGNIVREKNYYLSILFLKFSGLCQNKVFGNNFGATATDLFDQYICLTSVKGIGPTIAAGLISEISGISRFDNDNALAKFSGIYWSERQSADFTAEDTFVRRTGNEYLRYYFTQAADQLRKYLPEYSQYYSRKYKESRSHKHKRALLLTARKAVRLIFALLREEKLYKPPASKGGIVKS